MPYADYEIHKKNARDYYWKHKKNILEKRAKHYLKNKEAIDKAHKKWADENKDKVKIYKYNASRK